ncbi:hypothetical protein [Candidatus Ichthyocystis sparus]|uniref:hypothetical protein n=1 Tax=Candidatus Ichthyocystis sparus TaxID=1561004 RepID=UPI000A89F56D|nr:hypothetical protein [Candidatus Ichthyocystis sparus]
MSTSPTGYRSSGSPFSDEDNTNLENTPKSTDKQSKANPLCAATISQEGAGESSIYYPEDKRTSKKEETCSPSFSVTSTSTNIKISTIKIPVWEQPTNGSSVEDLLRLIEKSNKSNTKSAIPALDAPPPYSATAELIKIIYSIETTSLDSSSSSKLNIRTESNFPKGLISETDLSKINFIKFIQSSISNESSFSEDHIHILREAIFSEAKIFENKSIEAINNNEGDSFIVSTKQDLLSHAVEEKLIHIFKENIEKIRSEFISLITCKSNASKLYENKLRISESEQITILNHMLMCYAKISERIILEEKTKCLNKIFVKFGNIHITRSISDKLLSLIEESPQITSTILTRKSPLIKEELSKKGCLDEPFIRNMIINCIKSEEAKTIEKKAKEIISKLCYKIIINSDQFVPRSVAVFRHITYIFIHNLAKKLGYYIRCNLSKMQTQEECLSPIVSDKPLPLQTAEKTTIESSPMADDVADKKTLQDMNVDADVIMSTDDSVTKEIVLASSSSSHYRSSPLLFHSDEPCSSITSSFSRKRPYTATDYSNTGTGTGTGTGKIRKTRDELFSGYEEEHETTPISTLAQQVTEEESTSTSDMDTSLPEMMVWEQPTNGPSVENLLCLVEGKSDKTSSASCSRTTELTLELTPLCTADELTKIVKTIEVNLSFLLSISADDVKTVKYHPAKSVNEVDLSEESFMEFVKSSIDSKCLLSDHYICTLREEIVSGAKIFENKLINTMHEDSFISSTKQSSLSRAVQEKMIEIFKENIDEMRSKFISSIPCNELEISETERMAVLIHMLMCYAKVAETIISKERIKCPETIFVKFGNVHITKALSNELHSLIKELPQVVSSILTKKHQIIKEKIAKEWPLNQSFIRNIIVNCTKSEEIKNLETRAKNILVRSCKKIVINNDILLPKSVAVYRHVMSIFTYNLLQSLENCVRINISALLSETSHEMSRQEETPIPSHKSLKSLTMEEDITDEVINPTSTTSYVITELPVSNISSNVEVPHEAEDHDYEEIKKSNNKLYSYLAEGCENIEKPIISKGKTCMSALTQLQLMSDSQPNSAIELIKSVKKIEIGSSTSSANPGTSTEETISERAMYNVKLSTKDFTYMIRQLLEEGSRVENSEIYKLKKEIMETANELELIISKVSSNKEEINSFIRETNQHHITNIIEIKLIDIFKANLIKVKERFNIALEGLQEKSHLKSTTGLIKLTLSEKSKNSIMMHMLMCYAKMSEELICSQKVLFSNLETFFSKIGKVYITKHLNNHFHMIKNEFHKIVTTPVIKTNASLIEGNIRSDGNLSRLMINNIISECMNGNELLLKEKIKSALSHHCSKIAMDDGQLIPSNPRVEKYLMEELILSLKEEIERFLVKSSTKHIEQSSTATN